MTTAPSPPSTREAGPLRAGVVAAPAPGEDQDTGGAPLPPADVVDLEAWKRFCTLVACSGGVDDRPERAAAAAPAKASPRFFRQEVRRVEHHQLNTLPFLMDRCSLRGRSVLEFGAGTAGLSVALAAAGVRRVTAIEPILANCEAGRWRVRAYGLQAIVHACHVADTCRLPFASGAFEAVVCSSVLQYVPDAARRKALLAEMMRVLEPGGLLIVCNSGNGLIPAGPHSSRWWSNLLPGWAARLGHNRGVTLWELGRAVSSLGGARSAGDGAVARWRLRAGSAASPPSLPRRALLGAYSLLDRTVCPRIGVPVEALMPYPELAFRKAGGPDEARAPDRG